MADEPTGRHWIFIGGGMIGTAIAVAALGLTGVFAADSVSAMDTDFERVAVDAEPASTFEGSVQDRPVDEYFLDTCSGCHGADRRGATGPALLPERLSQSDEYYAGVITNGKPGTVMPTFSAAPYELSGDDIATLIGFIRSDTAQPPAWPFEDVEASHTVLVDEATLPSEPTHDGNMENLMLITERETQSIAVVDGDTHTLLTHVPASYRAHGYTFSPTDERWAYNMGRDGWVFKIDLYSLQPVRKVRIGLDSRAIAISDDGNYLIAGNYVPATLVMLDAHTLEVLKVWNTTGLGPDGDVIESRVATILDVSPELVGPYFVVGLKEAGQVWRIDWSLPGFPVTAVHDVGHILHDGFLSIDNKTFYLASQTDDWMAAIDVESMTVVEEINTGTTPHPGSGATWTLDGKNYGATVHAAEGKVSVWDMDTNEVVGQVETAGAGLFLRAHDLSPYVWADAVFAEEPHSITVFDKTPPFEVIGVITDGVRTLHPEFTSDGALVYVSDWDGHLVRVYDAYTLELVAEIEGIDNPTGIFNTERRLETLGH